MESTLALILAVLSTLGVAGILVAIVQAKFNQKLQLDQKQQELKQQRYLSILIQMLAKLNPEQELVRVKGEIRIF